MQKSKYLWIKENSRNMLLNREITKWHFSPLKAKGSSKHLPCVGWQDLDFLSCVFKL